jgi:hypothetical protein
MKATPTQKLLMIVSTLSEKDSFNREVVRVCKLNDFIIEAIRMEKEAIEQAYMAGQNDCKVDASASMAQEYYLRTFTQYFDK